MVAANNGDDPAVDRFLSESRSVPLDEIAPHLYCHADEQAIRHLFRVAASLDSMVIGEPQILGQIKAAYAAAKAHGALSSYLEAILTRAFSVAKRVRTETGIGENAVSVSYAAVELAREIFGTLAGKTVMIVGAGKMSELAAQHLHRSGATDIFVTNRTYERARELAGLFQGTIVEYDRFLFPLPQMDIVITSSAAPHYILKKADLRRIIEARRNRPMFLIDIAVPAQHRAGGQRDRQRLPLRHRRLAARGGGQHRRAAEAGRAGRGDYRSRSRADDGAPEGARGGPYHRQPAGAARTDAPRRRLRACAASSGRSRRNRRRRSKP